MIDPGQVDFIRQAVALADADITSRYGITKIRSLLNGIHVNGKWPRIYMAEICGARIERNILLALAARMTGHHKAGQKCCRSWTKLETAKLETRRPY